MPTVRFLGRILPPVFKITLSDIPTVNWTGVDQSVQVPFHLRIQNSEVEVDCELAQFQDADLHSLYPRAYDLTRTWLDIGGFATGQGYTLVLEYFIRPDGLKTPLVPMSAHLAPLCTAYKVPAETLEEKIELSKIFSLVLSENALGRALNDLAQTLTFHNQSPVNCARALEGLRKIVAPDEERRQGWPELRQIVNSDVDYMKWITDRSTNPRHGDRSFISQAVLTEIVQRSWTIMNRFLEYRKRGNQPLPEDEFPLLTPINVPV